MGKKSVHYRWGTKFKPEISKKVWGTETIISRHPYATKIMTVTPGQQVSLHLHKDKSETFVLISGTLIVEIYNQSGEKSIIELTEQFSSITLPAMTPHTFYTPDKQEESTIFIESSSLDHPDDSYRLSKSGPRRKVTDSR